MMEPEIRAEAPTRPCFSMTPVSMDAGAFCWGKLHGNAEDVYMFAPLPRRKRRRFRGKGEGLRPGEDVPKG